MTKKSIKATKPKPANLTAHQQKQIVQAIMKQFPELKEHEDKIEFMVLKYSEDKNYIQRLHRDPEELSRFADETQAEVKTYSPSDPEYHDIMARMDKAREEYEKQNILPDNIDAVSLPTSSAVQS